MGGKKSKIDVPELETKQEAAEVTGEQAQNVRGGYSFGANQTATGAAVRRMSAGSEASRPTDEFSLS